MKTKILSVLFILLISGHSFAEEAPNSKPDSKLPPECSAWTGNPAGMLPRGTYILVKNSSGNWVKGNRYIVNDSEFQVRGFFEDPATKKQIVSVLDYCPSCRPQCVVHPFWVDDLVWYN